MTEPETAHTPTAPGLYSCGSCDQQWSGVSRCHCAANHTAQVDFLAPDAKKAKIVAAKFRSLYSLGAASHLLAELVRDPLASTVKRPRFVKSDPMLTRLAPVSSGSFTRVSWGTPNGSVIELDELLLDGPAAHPASRIVALQHNGRQFFLRSVLPRTRGEQPAISPGDLITLRISAGCHRTFAGEGAFNLHQVGPDGCLDPATLLRSETSANPGSRLLFLTNGLWSGEEHPVDRGANLRAARARHTEELTHA